MGTGDDFLTGVTTLGEADSTDKIEIEHLRHKFLDCGGRDGRQTGPNIFQIPAGRFATDQATAL